MQVSGLVGCLVHQLVPVSPNSEICYAYKLKMSALKCFIFLYYSDCLDEKEYLI